MATQVQNRRGTTAEHSTFTGANGELTVDTTKRTLVVHDGSTAGGRPLLREDQSNLPTSAPTTGIYNASGSLAISANSVGRVQVTSTGTVNIVGAGTLGTSQAVSFNGSAPTNSLVIDSSGRVGLGTSSPAAGLHLVSAGQATSALNTAGDLNTIISDTGISAGNGGSLVFAAASGQWRFASIKGLVTNGSNNTQGDIVFSTRQNATDSTLTERVRIDSQGRVGVGTTSPSYALDVASADTTAGIGYALRLRQNATAGAAAIQFTDNPVTTQYGYIACDSSSNIKFTTGLTEKARLDASGRLLVGTSSSLGNYLNQVNYDGAASNGVYIRSSATSGDGSFLIELRRQSAPNNTSSAVLFSDSSAIRFDLRNNGGFANYQANNVNLSDINSKKDISPAAGTWDCIKEWEIINYRYKDQPDNAGLNLGVIAQQVAQSCPEVITVFEEAKDDKPEKLGVKEQQMYWMAIKALQEAQVRIETLEAKVAALESV